MELGRPTMGTRRALIYSSLDRYSVFAINFALMAVVSRLLSPRDVGIVTVGHALNLMAGTFRDFGVNAYLIQAPTIVRRDVQSAFTISLMLSASVAAVFYGASGLIAGFYAEPGLVPVIEVCAAIFLIDTFFYPQYALLRREMAFGAILVVDVAAASVSLVSFCILAALGCGYMSVVWAGLANVLTATALTIAFRPYMWVYRPSLREWKRFLSFGRYSVANGLLTVFYSSLPQLILGRLLNFGALGLFSRAAVLCQLPDRLVAGALQPVLLPALAARARNGGDLKEPYLRSLGLITAVQWPVLLCIAFLADPIVALLFGPQWRATAPLARIIALGSLTMFPVFLTYPLLVALGRIGDVFRCSLVSLLPSALLILLAADFSLWAVAASMIVIGPFQGFLALRFVRRRVPFRWGELFAATRKSAAVGLCAALAPLAAVSLSGLRFDLSLSSMLIAAIGATLGWFAGLRLTGHPLVVDEMRMAMQHATASIREICAARWPGRTSGMSN